MTIIKKYFSDLSDEQMQQFSALYDMYFDWNSKINVISRKDMNFFYERHVLHSLAIAKVIHFTNGSKVLDVGTGGGFPGIPLSILFPKTQFFLLDSIGKKIKVVRDVSDRLGLKNVTSVHNRVENITQKYDFVVSRAVTNMPQFLKWVAPCFLSDQRNKISNGILYLKGGDLIDEMAKVKSPFQFYDLAEYFEEDFFKTKKVVHVQMT